MKLQCHTRLLAVGLAVVLLFGFTMTVSVARAWDVSDLLGAFDQMAISVGRMSYMGLEVQKNRVNDGLNLHALAGADVYIDWNSLTGYWQLRERKTGEWYKNIDGRFPYAEADENHPAPSGSTAATTVNYPGAPELSGTGQSANQWLDYAPIQQKVQNGALTSNTTFTYDQLKYCLDALRKKNPSTNYRFGTLYDAFFCICKNNQVLCDSKGHPFMAVQAKESSAVNQEFTYNKVEINKTENNVDQSTTIENPTINENPSFDNSFSQIISQDNRTFNISTDNSTEIGQYIESLYWDDSTHTYTANTYDITYNNDNRTYETNYYTWNITYNVTNTYVTYIGSNDAWEQEAYTFYYELPDGRSSADLTADEVAALSFQFYDCINYNRSATDSSLRALFHFDGDLDDDGFFSNRTGFRWTGGASITYMDSSAFNGALYLDETAHSFDITLPSSIYNGQDFTIQWRYYQASQPDTEDNVENALSIGGLEKLHWDERHLYWFDTKLCPLPIGNWCELALIRQDGTLRYYVNGVCVYSVSDSAPYGNKLTFSFGDTSRAYSMIDELRVLNFALTSNGVNYTPTSVPYDTNLVLTLPGTEVVTDSYWNFKSDGNLVAEPDFSTGTTVIHSYGGFSGDPGSLGKWVFVSESDAVPASACQVTDAFVHLENAGSTSWQNKAGLTYDLAYYKSQLDYAPGVPNLYSKNCVFSVVDKEGNIYSLPVRFSSTLASTSATTFATATFDWGALSVRWARHSSGRSMTFVEVTCAPGKSLDIIYAEFALGTATSLTAEKVSCQYQVSDLTSNTAAVQTDIPITGYTVGGVRPTFPKRGNVWFAVSGGRISGVQVYNGQAWEASNARWWTGVRWIPIYAFDIYTLEDCWDVADTDDVVTVITTESGFWNWWKGQWSDFRSWLTGLGGGSGPDPSPSPEPSSEPELPRYVRVDGAENLTPGDYLLYCVSSAPLPDGTAGGFLSLPSGHTDAAWMPSEQLPIEGDTVTTDNTTCVWTLAASGSGYTFCNQSSGLYLYYTGRAGGFHYSYSLPDGLGVWQFVDVNGGVRMNDVYSGRSIRLTPHDDTTLRFEWGGATWLAYRREEPPPEPSDILGIVPSLFNGLWSLASGSFSTVFHGVSGFFDDVSGGIDDFYGVFESPNGVFGFYTYEGDDIWD